MKYYILPPAAGDDLGLGVFSFKEHESDHDANMTSEVTSAVASAVQEAEAKAREAAEARFAEECFCGGCVLAWLARALARLR